MVGLVEPVRLLQPQSDQYFLLTLEQSLMQAEHNVGRASLHTKYIQTGYGPAVLNAPDHSLACSSTQESLNYLFHYLYFVP